MGIFVKKSIAALITEASDSEKGLKKTLSANALIGLGIGAIIGAGLFSITGMAAAHHAGPGIMISFVIAALGCAFAGLCYAEFASMIPVAGSAYTYSYATMGEFLAWIIGWDLVLEYAVGAATVASSWSGYLNKLFASYGVALPESLMSTPFDGGIANLPAVFIVVLMSLLLVRGTSGSAKVNAIIVILKVSIVLIFIIIGMNYIRPENLKPLIPENTGEFGSFGWSGVIRAAAIVFFAYIGFDAVSTAAQETKNPKRDMPIGIMGSLAITTVLYIVFAYVMVGVAPYEMFKGDGLAPVATAIEYMGPIVNGVPNPDYPWLNTAIIVSILLGYASVILVMLLGQSRVFYSMSHDGLVPKFFSELHIDYRTPYKSNLLFMLLVSCFAAFVPGRIVGEMTSIGTLFAFILVCAGVLVLRYKMEDAPRGFRTPFVPFVPILGILVCLGMMVFLPFDTWIRLIVWMIIGLDIYAGYGMKNSLLQNGTFDRRGHSIVNWSIISISILLIIVAVFHHQTAGEKDFAIFYFSMIVAFVHLAIFGYKQLRLK
ncbi:MAG: amino acid permease [Saprospiraceae bacterium]|nr:MAG: amino acid permease [Bacteroidetes bacterium OLB9]MCO6464524.1 amino acid permease [Saprospiraceae bacterium]